jgi:hypothetical protein
LKVLDGVQVIFTITTMMVLYVIWVQKWWFDQVLFSKIQIVPKCGTCNAGNLQWESLFILKKGQTYPYFWNECPYPSDTDTLYTFMYLCPYH